MLRTYWVDHSDEVPGGTGPPLPPTFDGERPQENGIELIYTPDAARSPCDEIATIQVVTIVDDQGNVKSNADIGRGRPRLQREGEDAAAANGHTVDVARR